MLERQTMHQVKLEIRLVAVEVIIQVSSNLRLNENLAFYTIISTINKGENYGK
jgi:hypothetical protein